MMSSTSPVEFGDVGGEHRDSRRAAHAPLTVEINLALEIRVVEDLHGDFLPSMVLGFQLGVVNGDILLDVAVGKDDFLVFPLAIHTHKCPIRHSHRYSEEEDHEKVCLEPAIVHDWEHALDNPWYDDDQGGEVQVAESAIAIVETLYGCVLYGWCVCLA